MDFCAEICILEEEAVENVGDILENEENSRECKRDLKERGENH